MYVCVCVSVLFYIVTYFVCLFNKIINYTSPLFSPLLPSSPLFRAFAFCHVVANICSFRFNFNILFYFLLFCLLSFLKAQLTFNIQTKNIPFSLLFLLLLLHFSFAISFQTVSETERESGRDKWREINNANSTNHV